jgi:unsaturated rhamnogalacturonyl hydrolase
VRFRRIAPRLPALLTLFVASLSCAANPPAEAPKPDAKASGVSSSSRDAIVEVMRRAADYQLDLQAKDAKKEQGWIRAAFYTGVMALYDTTKDSKYLDAAMKWADEQGHWTIANSKNDPRFADNFCCGQVYTELYFLKHDQPMIEPFRAACDNAISDTRPGREIWWWCDALYMEPAALVRLAKATGERKYIDFMDKTWWDATDFLYDKQEHLFYRDKRYFDAKTKNGKKVFWSRGNGWVMGGIARVLDDLPQDHPSRPKFVELHRAMADKLASVQQADGLWRPSLLDPDEFPSPETSGSAFFIYSIAWGINHGTLDRAKFLPVVTKAWPALVEKVTPEGRLGYVQKVAGAPGAVNPDDTHEYAVGALLLAGREMIKLGGSQ